MFYYLENIISAKTLGDILEDCHQIILKGFGIYVLYHSIEFMLRFCFYKYDFLRDMMKPKYYAYVWLKEKYELKICIQGIIDDL